MKSKSKQPDNSSVVDAEPSKPASKKRSLKGLAYGTGLFILLVLLGLCKYEVLWTSSGPMLLAKDRFTLSESFVSLDAVRDLPFKVGEKEWPVTYAALIRDGVVKPLPKFSAGRWKRGGFPHPSSALPPKHVQPKFVPKKP